MHIRNTLIPALAIAIAGVFLPPVVASARQSDDSRAQWQEPMPLNRETALERARQLRSEAAAHREMEKLFGSAKATSRRVRRWNANVVQLCRCCVADAEEAASSYERIAPSLPPAGTGELNVVGVVPPILSPPMTADEYIAKAAAYQQRAKTYRADADRHAAMLAQNPYSDNRPRAYPGTSPALPGVNAFDTPQTREMREHCNKIVQDSIALARDAEDFARHCAVRAQQLSSVK